MLSRFNPPLEDLFTLPLLIADSELRIEAVNDVFSSLFGDVTGRYLGDISPDFNERKLSRRLDQNSSYRCRLAATADRQAHYALELTRSDGRYIGFAVDASEAVKAEVMLASYSEMVERQNREIKQKNEQINIWRSRIENELQQAETVQDLLVPKQLSAPFVDSRCEPLQELSGDFHEFVTHPTGEVTFISGDVAGKGIHAAIVLAQTLTSFRACYAEPCLAQLAVRMVDMLDGRFPDGLFVAFTLVRLSADKSTASILNLGNPDAILLAADTPPVFFASAGPAIGIFPSSFYADLNTEQISLSGRRLYVFSDGILDMNLGPEHKGFADINEVADYLMTLEAHQTEDVLDRLIDDVRRNDQTDDVTIACFSAVGNEPDIPVFRPMLAQLELSSFFTLPLVRLDGDYSVCEMNEVFAAQFSSEHGASISEVSDDFNPRKAARKLTSGSPYAFTILSSDAQKTPYRLELRALGDEFIGYATDASDAAKAEAMLESYSEMMEKQVRILNAETRTAKALLSSLVPEQVLADLQSLQGSKPQRHLNMPMMMISLMDFDPLAEFDQAETLFSALDEQLTSLDLLAEQQGLLRLITDRNSAVILPLHGPEKTGEAETGRCLSILALCTDIMRLLTLSDANSDPLYRMTLHYGDMISAITGKRRLSFDLFGSAIEELIDMHDRTAERQCLASPSFYRQCQAECGPETAAGTIRQFEQGGSEYAGLYKLTPQTDTDDDRLREVIDLARRSPRAGR